MSTSYSASQEFELFVVSQDSDKNTKLFNSLKELGFCPSYQQNGRLEWTNNGHLKSAEVGQIVIIGEKIRYISND